MKRILIPIAAVLLAFTITACAGSLTDATLNTELPFVDRQDRIGGTVGLYVSPDSRTFIARQSVRKDAGMSKQTVDFTCDVGPALVPNALRSLGKTFDRVVEVQDPAQPEPRWIVWIDVNPETAIKMGPMTFSKHTVRVVLDCAVLVRGTQIWSGRLDSTATDSAAAGLLAGGVFAVYARQKSLGAMQQAGEESLYVNLETLNERLFENRRVFK